MQAQFTNGDFESSMNCGPAACDDDDLSCIDGWWNYFTSQNVDGVAWKSYSCTAYTSCGDLRGMYITGREVLFLIFGLIQRLTSKIMPFAIAIDRQGNELWHRYYGNSGINSPFQSAVKVSENEIVIGNNITDRPDRKGRATIQYLSKSISRQIYN